MKISRREIWVHGSLFIVTFVTTTLAGAEWTYGKSVWMPGFSWADFVSGMPYSIPFLLILTCHEFGHYFTAVYYRVKTTLPYYIPLPPFLFMFGTLGALIRLKSRVVSKKQNFDIGIAGPLAGFVVALLILWYGFSHLPPAEHIYQFHPEYEQYGLQYDQYVYGENATVPHYDVIIGKSLLWLFFENFVADPVRVPNPHEIMHYPFLFAGFLSLVFTSINLLPIGQLDGGHVLYGLVGFKRHRMVASVVFIGFLIYAGLGYINPYLESDQLMMKIPLAILFAYVSLTGLMLPWRDTLMYALGVFAVVYLMGMFFPAVQGYPGWLLFIFIIGRFIRVPHPPSEVEEPLDPGRQLLGWIALLIFVLCFTPKPIEILLVTPAAPAPGA